MKCIKCKKEERLENEKLCYNCIEELHNKRKKNTEESILSCMAFINMGIKENDRDSVRSYYEQLNDLIIEFLGEEK